MSNVGLTVLGMWAGSAFVSAPVDSPFFQQMERPVQPDEAPPKGANPAAPVLGLSTFAVGLLLAVAGALSGSQVARIIDFSTAAVLLAIGILFRRKA